jgi:hypothetical protein
VLRSRIASAAFSLAYLCSGTTDDSIQHIVVEFGGKDSMLSRRTWSHLLLELLLPLFFGGTGGEASETVEDTTATTVRVSAFGTVCWRITARSTSAMGSATCVASRDDTPGIFATLGLFES